MSRLRALAAWTWRHRWLAAGLAVIVGLAGGGAGLAVGLALEENNEFCSSCHTQPEYDFFQRTLIPNPHDVSDLATRHVKPVKTTVSLTCISCHGGVTLTDRVETIANLGILDSIKFVRNSTAQVVMRRTRKPMS
ncbi:MAG: hypothetical protein HY259_06535 [Chloroflexi bacterium]|nr:hypothetical protein [Chloroflexota bacterium]